MCGGIPSHMWGVSVCHWTAWGSSQPIFPSASRSLWIAALPSNVSATALVVLSMRLLKVHCVLAFESLVKTNSISPSIGPIISPWGMPVVASCQVGLDSADHNDSLSRMVQRGFHPAYPTGPYNYCRNLCWIPCWNLDKQHCSLLGHWNSHLIREDRLIMYNLLLINLFSYLTLHLFDSGIQGPELNWNFGLFFCRFSLLSMGRTLAFFHLTGDSPSCCDLSGEVESSLVMVLAGSFTPLRGMLGGCLEWSSVPLVPGDSSKKGMKCPSSILRSPAPPRQCAPIYFLLLLIYS